MNHRIAPLLCSALALSLSFACAEKETDYVYIVVPSDGATPRFDAKTLRETGSAAAGGAAAGGAAGSDQTSTGGAAGAGEIEATADASESADVSDSNSIADAGVLSDAMGDSDQGECSADTGCPPPDACASVYLLDVPADCHATIFCTDRDAATRVVDQNNVPVPSSPCLIGTCNKAGEPGTAPGPVGTPCSSPTGERLCDGLGNCVQCLQSSDCAAGLFCDATRRCVTASCTDVDCGGVCPPCANGKKCLSNADCLSAACDAASLTCVASECTDHRQDGLETDADCGGGICVPCALGKSCLLSSDCATQACDAFMLRCVSDPCRDRRKDGVETDVDCGGGSCNSCQPGQACGSNLDCAPGHVCNSKKVCQ
jgi:Cys-rich repeat protein